MSKTRIGSITVHIDSDVHVQTQAPVSDHDKYASDTIAVFVKDETLGMSIQLSGRADDLRKLADGILAATTAVEQRKLAQEVVAGF